MKIPHFLSSYLKQSKELMETHSEERAMSLAVGGDFEAVGILEFSLLKQLGLAPEQTVIDVGCGSGRLASQLKDYLTGKYIGIDVVPDLYEYARKLCKRDDWKFYSAPGTKIPEPDASADFVTFFSVFTHLQHEETYRYLQEAKRVLKPGGKIVFSFLEFRLPSHWFIFENSVKDEREDKVLNQFMDRDMIQNFANHLGLEIVALHDGHLPHIELDRPVHWDSGLSMQGIGNLGQSVCVLRRQEQGLSKTKSTLGEAKPATTRNKANPAIPLDLIKNPTTTSLPGCLVTFVADEEYNRPSQASFWDDPFGVGFKRPTLGTTVQLRRYVLELDSRWTLDGHRFFVNPDVGFIGDKIFKDSEASAIFASDLDTSLQFNQEDGRHVYHDKLKHKIHLSGRVGVATSVEPSNWGSFVTRIAPKALALKKMGCEKLLAYHNNPRQLELLKLCGWRDEQIVKFNPTFQYVMETAVYPSEWTSNLYVSPTSLALLQGLAKEPLLARPGRKLYVSRNKGMAAVRSRACLNASEVESMIESKGIEIISPDLLSVSEQIDVFSSAELIIGPSGAGLFNSVFCTPHTKLLDIESQKNWLWGHANLFSSTGIEFGIHLAKADESSPQGHKPYWIDTTALSRRIDALL